MLLKAVFWDTPELQNEIRLREFLGSSKTGPDREWILSRFLERGRVVDTLSLFSWDEITKNLEVLPLGSYAKQKWLRLVEVYLGNIGG